MDKLKSGRTITIKINGKNQPFIDEQKKEEYQIGSDPSESASKAQIEQEGFHETAASQELEEESFDWILPEVKAGPPITSVYKKATSSVPKKNKVSTAFKNPSSFKSIIFTVIFAVMVGTSFGILMLRLVVSNHSKPAAVETSTPASPAGIEATSGSATAAMKSFTIYVIQEGVYSSNESAKGIAKLAAEKNVPAGVIEINGQYFLFLGIANSLDGAKGMESIYKDKGINEPYSKALTVPEKSLANLTQKEKTFIEAAPDYFTTLSKAASSAMSGAVIPADVQKSLLSIAISDQGIQNKQIKNMAAALAGAIEELKSYDKSKDEQSVGKAEQHLLTFLQLYYSL